nr:MAG TPA: tail repeat-like protein [Caudoviricetes sp.]
MANVYVGFRYVTLFCGAWDNSKGYEALSVVTHNGGGYTSNKPVPAGIEPGTDNGEYWAYTYRAGGEASAIDWDKVQNKPSTYPTTWEKVDGKPNVFPTNWENIEDIPTTFPPSTHPHNITDINGLNTELEELTNDISGLTATLQTVNNNINTIITSTGILPSTPHNWDLFRVCILLYMWRYIIKEEI